MRPAKDVDLVEAVRRGDAGARDRLLDLRLPLVLQWCARLGGPRVDAEDAAHDVFVVVLTRMDTVTDLSAFDSWLFGVTRRVLASHRRKAWIRRWAPGLMADTADPGAGPSRRTELSETGRRVQQALDTLPDLHREVLVLCDFEERTDTEVAALLGIPSPTVRSRLRLARDRFRREADRLKLSTALMEAARGEGE